MYIVALFLNKRGKNVFFFSNFGFVDVTQQNVKLISSQNNQTPLRCVWHFKLFFFIHRVFCFNVVFVVNKSLHIQTNMFIPL